MLYEKFLKQSSSIMIQDYDDYSKYKARLFIIVASNSWVEMLQFRPEREKCTPWKLPKEVRIYKKIQ